MASGLDGLEGEEGELHARRTKYGFMYFTRRLVVGYPHILTPRKPKDFNLWKKMGTILYYFLMSNLGGR